MSLQLISLSLRWYSLKYLASVGMGLCLHCSPAHAAAAWTSGHHPSVARMHPSHWASQTAAHSPMTANDDMQSAWVSFLVW
eukprot:5068323-Prorocentrum_lima.AAC.1